MSWETLTGSLEAHLKNLSELGFSQLSRATKKESFAAAGAPSLSEICAEIGDCQRCRLAKGRNRLVFGSGNPKARLMFIGEGPGADEDREGLPFVGRAGVLLTKMIEAMGYRRDEVYICNVVKCRPPNNRNPEPDELAACEPFWKAQVRAILPATIVTLGNVPTQTILKTDSGIGKMRGHFHDYDGIPLMPTYHPAFLLRSPQYKKQAWEDLQQVIALLKEKGVS